MRCLVRYTGISEIGLIRKENQDRVAVVEKDHALLALVCDGIGGGNAGSVASDMVITMLKEAFEDTNAVVDVQSAITWFGKRIKEVNKAVYQESLVVPSYAGMGTTLVACFIFENEAVAFNIGDSRIYRYDGNFLESLSHDQTYAYELYLRNEIAFEDIENHPRRNVLMNAVGIDEHIAFETVEIKSGWHHLLLSSDGLHGYVSHDAMENAMRKSKIETKRNTLLKLAYEAGGYDNISFVLIEGDKYE